MPIGGYVSLLIALYAPQQQAAYLALCIFCVCVCLLSLFMFVSCVEYTFTVFHPLCFMSQYCPFYVRKLESLPLNYFHACERMASLDSELRDDSQSLESSQLFTPVDKTSSVSPKTISVICGSVSGELYLNKLSNWSSSKLGGIKCVLSDSSWYSLTEFESLGGKAKSKNWRKSVTVADSNVQLGAFLQSIGSSGSETPASSPSHVGSPSARPKHSQSGSLIDPVLAYIKAYRLKGDSAGLKQSVCSSFDSSALSSAHRRLWDYCSKELEQLGLPYHARRGSDKHHLSD